MFKETSTALAFLAKLPEFGAAIAKLEKAQQLVVEARAEIARIVSSKPATKKKSKAKAIEYGIDVPDALETNERKVLELLQGAEPMRKKAIAEAVGLGEYATEKALEALAKRRLAKATGRSFGKKWEAK